MTTGTQVQKVQDKTTTVLNHAKAEFSRSLPAHIDAEKFVRTIQTAISLNPQLKRAAEKSEGGMRSLLLACAKAAADGLIIDGREAALTTFRTNTAKKGETAVYEDRVQYLPMYQGLLKKMRNSGSISNITAHVVYEKDHFVHELGDNERIEHKPFEGDDRGPGVKVYAIAKLKDGTVQREVMTKRDVMNIAAQGKNPDQYDQTKGKNWGQWWRKTVLRRISNYLPSSSDQDWMLALKHADEEFDFDRQVDAAEELVNRKARGKGAAAMQQLQTMPQVEDENQDQGATLDYDPQTGEVIEPKHIDRDLI